MTSFGITGLNSVAIQILILTGSSGGGFSTGSLIITPGGTSSRRNSTEVAENRFLNTLFLLSPYFESSKHGFDLRITA